MAGANEPALSPAALTLVAVATVDGRTRIHLYPDASALIAGGVFTLAGPDDVIRPAGMRFFTREGVHLVPAFTDGWTLVDLVDADEKPAQHRLLAYLQDTVADIKRYALDNPELLGRFEMTPQDVIARLPVLDGLDLPHAFDACVPFFSNLESNNGSPLHNLLVHGIG